MNNRGLIMEKIELLQIVFYRFTTVSGQDYEKTSQLYSQHIKNDKNII